MWWESELSSRNLKDKEKEGANPTNFKIPDRIEDMSPLPSPHRKNNFNDNARGRLPSASPDFGGR